MYFILDGHVDFSIDLKKNNLRIKQIEQLAKDLGLCQKELMKNIMDFKNRTGLDKMDEEVVTDIKLKM